MKLNGHELEIRYVNDITVIKQCKENKLAKVLFAVTVHKCKSRLKERLKRLEKSFNDGFIDKGAYQISEVLSNLLYAFFSSFTYCVFNNLTFDIIEIQ